MTIPKIFTVYLYFKDVDDLDDLDNNELLQIMRRIDVEPIIKKINDPIEALPNKLPNKLKEPHIYVSIGEKWELFKQLTGLPFYEKKKWLHFTSIDQITLYKLFYCWLGSSEPHSYTNQLTLNQLPDRPLVSVFTSTYRSGDRIQRPYQSLLKQTYSNWEWVIVDDSGDNDETWNNFLTQLTDKRIRKYKQSDRNGRIGSVKRDAAGLCRGRILVELDHDDELIVTCLEHIVDAFTKHPDCGFVYGDFSEVYENNYHAHWYGWDAGYGYLTYWRQYVPMMKRWQNVCRTPDLNWKTIRHLVGLPNHPRAWRYECYHLIGGHNPELSVADDYDLLIRTFLVTKWVRIPHLLYIQYRNSNSNNQTIQRNQQIQTLCHYLQYYYRKRINKRLLDLEIPSLQNQPYNRIYRLPPSHVAHQHTNLTHLCELCKCYIFPYITPADIDDLAETLQKVITKCQQQFWHHQTLIVVGRIPPLIEEIATSSPPGSIRWWPFDHDITIEEAIRWGLQIRSGQIVSIKLPSSYQPRKQQILSLSLPPNANTPNPDTPNSDTHNSDTPNSDTPNSDTPNSDTPNSDTPKPDIPNSDTPNSDTQ